jgi:hypothetical protein
MARPSLFNSEVADRICNELAEGKSLREICASEDLPHIGTICRWVATNTEFREQYARAREAQAELFADELLAIADDGTNDWMEIRRDGECVGWRENGEALRRSALRVDTRQWIASKILPKKYGDVTRLVGDRDQPLRIVVDVVRPDRGNKD